MAKKILFMIFNSHNGRGGHYYSLYTLIQSYMAQGIECAVLPIGKCIPPIFHELDCEVKLIKINPFNWINRLRKVKTDFIDTWNPTVIHCFDSASFSLLMYAWKGKNCPLVLTKAGGKNSPLPYVRTLHLFSKENYDFHTQQEELKDSSLHLIPNRVIEPITDHTLVESIRHDVGQKKVILRIGRISSAYYKTTLQAIELVRLLNANEERCYFVSVGEIQETDVFQKLKKESSDIPSSWYTDPLYTNQASKIIKAGDLVVGTGRSLMEAASKGVCLLAPTQNNGIPTLVSEQNFDTLFYYNFSPRCILPESDEDILIRIESLLSDPNRFMDNSNRSRALYKQFFSVENAFPALMKMYDEAGLALPYNKNQGVKEIAKRAAWISWLPHPILEFSRKIRRLRVK